MRLDTLAGGLSLIGGLWFGVCAVLWGVANTLDGMALTLHRFAGAWRAVHARRTAELSQAWVRTLERGLAAPAPQDEAFLRARGIAPGYVQPDDSFRGYTGE